MTTPTTDAREREAVETVRAEERARCASAIRYRMNMLANALPYDAGAVNVALSDMVEALTGGPHE